MSSLWVPLGELKGAKRGQSNVNSVWRNVANVPYLTSCWATTPVRSNSSMASSSYPSMPFSISTVCCPISGGGLGCDMANSLYLTAGPVKKSERREIIFKSYRPYLYWSVYVSLKESISFSWQSYQSPYHRNVIFWNYRLKKFQFRIMYQ